MLKMQPKSKYLAMIFNQNVLLAIFMSHSDQNLKPKFIVSYFSESGLTILFQSELGNYIAPEFIIN